jgi:hypothetical protein
MGKTMPAVKLALTFDHELPLGSAGDYDRCLFASTARLLRMAAEVGVPVTLFTDVLSALRFREWDRVGFYEPYCRQLREALALGHDVQLHLHPHWITSTYVDGRFVPSQDYALRDFVGREPPEDVDSVVRAGVDLLREICDGVRKDHRIVAFRAGGYDLGVGETDVLSALWRSGIRMDSSVAKGNLILQAISHVDHRRMPRQANWFVDPGGALDTPAASGIYMVPIVARPRSAFGFGVDAARRMWVRLRHPERSVSCPGTGLRKSRMPLLGQVSGVLRGSLTMLTFDGPYRGPKEMVRLVQQYVRHNPGQGEIHCSSVSHPKYMGDHHLSVMRGFVELARESMPSLSFTDYSLLAAELPGLDAGVASPPRAD